MKAADLKSSDVKIFHVDHAACTLKTRGRKGGENDLCLALVVTKHLLGR